MRRSTWAWMALLALCLGTTAYEIPNIVISVRQCAWLFVDAEEHFGFFVSQRLAAQDPEASDVLRHALSGQHSEPAQDEIEALLGKYPDNEFLMTSLAAARVSRGRGDYRDVQPIIERLQAFDPNNAYYAYLQGWALLRTSGGARRLPEALQAFARGHGRTQFHAPYQKYKATVDLLAEKAVLGEFDRPWIWPFYQSLDDIVSKAARWEGIDSNSYRDLIGSATRLADRAMDNAYDIDSLSNATDLVRETEQTRLKELDLSQAEAWRARLRLSQAIATEELRRSWSDDNVLADATWMCMTPWFILFVIALGLLVRRGRPAKKAAKTGLAPAISEGLMILIAIGVFLVTYRMRSAGFWSQMLAGLPWFLIAMSWFDYASDLAQAGCAGPIAIRRLHANLAVGLLALNGVLLLLVSNTAFLWTRSLAGWSQHLAVFATWLALCLLLWRAMGQDGAVLGRISRHVGLAAIVCWVGFLLACDLTGTVWHYQSRAYAQPLSVCGPLPVATQETYERVIRDGGPPSYRRDDPSALPEHIHYFAPEDLETFLTRRQAGGHPLAKQQLQDLLAQSARDIRPIIRAALDSYTPSETGVKSTAETENPS